MKCDHPRKIHYTVLYLSTHYFNNEEAYKVVTFGSKKSLSVTTLMKATEQYFSVVLLIMLYKEVRPFESVDEILKCDFSNMSCQAVFLRCC